MIMALLIYFFLFYKQIHTIPEHDQNDEMEWGVGTDYPGKIYLSRVAWLQASFFSLISLCVMKNGSKQDYRDRI